MKILLANPPCRIEINNEYERAFVRAGSRWPFSTLKKKKDKLSYIPFPFYLAYTASLLKNNNFDVHVLDAIPLNLTIDEFIERTIKINPDLILFETSTPTIDYDLKLVKKLKKTTKSIVVLTGTHATVFPEEIMGTCDEVDYIITNEYEIAFLQLAKAIHQKNNVGEIKNLIYRNKGHVIVNSHLGIMEHLDDLPYPAYEMFPDSEFVNCYPYWDGFCQKKPAIQMHTSRGCPFKCDFCLWNQVIYRNGTYRMFSPKRVVDEMEFLIERLGAKEIYFDDDDFTANKNHVLEICKEIHIRKLKINWSCMGDAMITDEEMIAAMSNAGCIGMKFGVESGNKEILKKIKKPIDFEKVKNIAKRCAKNRIKTHGTFTFGLTGETKETMNQTMAFAKDLDVDSVQFSITTPFPGTKYYKAVQKDGLIIAKNWQDYDGANNSVVMYDNLKNEEVIEFCDKASGVWLRHKIKDYKWVRRQFCFLIRLIKGHGLRAFFCKFRRAVSLIVKS